MKVSKNWLKELVEIKVSDEELTHLLPLRTIALKENTPELMELDMKGYNRADLLSLRGVAYEVAAITNSEVKFQETDPNSLAWANQDLPKLNVQVEDEKLCPLYCLAKIGGLQVASSNTDWIQKLLNSGVRSVNNIADVTNLVMLEYGQPLHAFDASQVKDETIIVRRAKEDEELRTLDDKTRRLTTDDLLITDSEKALGIAGVMGGKNSEITDSTTTVLLEAAIFEPGNLRKTANRLGLNSEASKRFYHGLTKKRLLQALDAAIKMYQGLGGTLTAITIVGDTEDPKKQVNLTLKKVNNLIGVEIDGEQVETFLSKLNFSVIASDQAKQSQGFDYDENTVWQVSPPYYRLDIDIEEDLIEEVARMYGYENIAPEELAGESPAKIDQAFYEMVNNLKNGLTSQGLTEIQTYSYFSTLGLENFGWLDSQDTWPLIKIANPMSAETQYLRHNLWTNLVEKAVENLKFFEMVEIFEVGKTYEVVDNKIHEEYRLAVVVADGSDNPLARLNKVLQTPGIASQFARNDGELEMGDKLPTMENQIFHPNRSAMLTINGQPAGGMAEIHPRVLDKFGTSKRVAIAEIKLQPISKS